MAKASEDARVQNEPEEDEQLPIWMQWVLVAIVLGLAVWFGLDVF